MANDHERNSSQTAFVDESTECAICLDPFDGDEAGGSQSRRTIVLKCGHKWHLSCLTDQLQTAQPVPGQRILFSGCQCAKCGTICEHVELEHLTRTTDVLREQVDALIKEQLELEAPVLLKNAQSQQPDPTKINPITKLLQEGRRKFAFYSCSYCKEPFFGGTIECADVLEPPTASSSSTEHRLCVACTPHSQTLCQNPPEHARYLIWKCRFCCQPATHVCYGNTHFCDDCHDRNSRRYKDHPPSSRPPHISPIPCPGPGSCPYPLPSDGPSNHHQNGPTIASEQVYGCAWCQSRTSDHDRRLSHQRRPGSHNLLQNPSGADQLQGWVQLNPRMSWKVEPLHAPLDTFLSTSNATTNYVSSYFPCIMQQTIDLEQILSSRSAQTADAPDQDLTFEVSALYMGRTDCPSVFRLHCTIIEAAAQPQDRVILAQKSTAVLEAPPDYWEKVELELPPVPASRARYVVVTVCGQDQRFWQGDFGSKVCDIQVRLLGTDDDLQKWFPPRPDDERDLVDAPPPRRRSLVWISLLRDGVLPVLALLLLAWLLQ